MSFRTRLFHLWFLLSRPMTLGVRVVVTDGQNRVLLVRHTYVSGWHLPGGGVDNGESSTQAAVRELEEETGLITSCPPELFGFYFNSTASKRDHVSVYIASETTGSLIKSNSEIAEIGYFDLDNLPEGTTKGAKARLAEIFAGAEVSDYW